MTMTAQTSNESSRNIDHNTHKIKEKENKNKENPIDQETKRNYTNEARYFTSAPPHINLI